MAGFVGSTVLNPLLLAVTRRPDVLWTFIGPTGKSTDKKISRHL